MEALSFLLNPISKSNFFSDYFQKRHLFIKRESVGYYSEIANIQSIDDFLEKNDILYPAIRLASNGKRLEVNSYCKYDSFMNQNIVNVDKVRKLYNTGATVVLQGVQRNFNSVRDFILRLQNDTNFKYGANIYMTPPNSKGFNYHFDDKDVFILQLKGQKRWYLYDSPVVLPTRKLDEINPISSVLKDYSIETPSFCEVLSEGDFLYIPRGLVHCASTETDHSIHCTINVNPLLWEDVVNKFAMKISLLEEFRDVVPLHENFSESFIASRFIDLIKKSIESNLIEELISDIITNQTIESRLQVNKNVISSSLRIDDVILDSIIEVNEGVRFLVYEDTDYLFLHFNDKKIPFPKELIGYFKFISSNKTFLVKELSGDNESNKLLFVKKMIGEGLLVVKKI